MPGLCGVRGAASTASTPSPRRRRWTPTCAKPPPWPSTRSPCRCAPAATRSSCPPASSLSSTCPQLDRQADLEHERNVRFQLFPVAAERSDFDEASDAPSSDLYYRLEVYGLTGSLRFDVYGYSQNQIINNVLDMYERHPAFLYMQQTQPGESDLSDGAGDP